MATPPPTDVPVWAQSAASADIAEPPQATIDAGWPFGVPPPHEWVNWWWNRVGDWIEYLNATLREFDDLGEAVDYAAANLAVGDRLLVFEDDNDTGPGVSEATLATGAIASNEGSVDANGELVVMSYGLQAFGVDRDFVAVATYAKSNGGSHQIIKTDGVVTVACYGNWVEAFNAVTGASLWDFDCGTDVFDVCMCAGVVYIVHDLTAGGADATAARQAHALDRDAGTINWSYQHSAVGELRSCSTNGRQLFVAGDASSYASAATLRAINAADGKDADSEGNNGLDTERISWDQAATATSTRSVLECDGKQLYIGFGSGAANQLEALAPATGETIWSFAHSDGTFNCVDVACDQDYVYAVYSDSGGTPEGNTLAHHKANGGPAWSYQTQGGGPPSSAASTSVVSDGQKVFLMGDDDDQFLRRISRGNIPTRFRVIDRDVEFIRYRNWPLQPEEQ